MKRLKIKETYLLLLIIVGLVSLALYTTYALFTASTEITDVVSFNTNLTTDSSILEYEMVTIPAGETKTIELVVTNSHTSSIYYGVWYQNLTGINDMNIGVYTEKNSTPASGTIDASSSKTILIGISNDSSSDLIINIGVVGSETSNLNLSSNRTLITDDWAPAIIVTSEYLEEHKTTVLKPITPLEYTTPAMTEVTLQPGEYKLEAWGAQGGSYSTSYVGGKGGYSYGTLTLTESTNLYVYVGGQATTNTSNRVVVTGGFNGGGNGYNRWYSSTYTYGQGGGGASDIRIGTDSLYARVIVAGGGSGSTNRTNGYYGGGETSGTGRSGYSASQTAAGTNGSFGTGGSATTSGNNYKYGSAGGGGGWYGGGASSSYSDNTNYDTYSGGGSGYVYTSSTASNCPSGCLLNSTYYLTNAATVAGNISFTDFSGSTVTGHSGNGAVRISGTGEVTAYTIPRVLGLSKLTITLGNNVNLEEGISYECEVGSTSCTYIGPNITDTSSLAIGEYTIYYTIKGSNGKKYNYPRIITVEKNRTSSEMLNYLNLTIATGTPDFSKTGCSTGCGESTVGIYSSEDDLGTSYYFRGDVTTNYVKFGKWSDSASDICYGYDSLGNFEVFNTLSECQNDSTHNSNCTLVSRAGKDMYWRIIRINGDGTIRLIYDGTSAHANGESSVDRQIGISVYNENSNDNAYFGYMYGSTGASDYATTHANINNSTIKTYLDNWYSSNLTNYSSYIADAIYCNDRKLSSNTSSTAGTSYYGGYYSFLERYYNNYSTPYTYAPTLKCTQSNDKFTVSEDLGNGNLTYPIGLITKDEEVFAGGIPGSINSKYYLYMDFNFWSITPNAYGSPGSGTYHNFCGKKMTSGGINESGSGESTTNGALHVNNKIGVKPVISLKSGLTFSGSGTATDPFRVE